MDAFRDLRGREPEIGPLLARRGLACGSASGRRLHGPADGVADGTVSAMATPSDQLVPHRPGRGPGDLPGPAAHRHLELRRRLRAGGAGRRRVRHGLAAPRSGSTRSWSSRHPGGRASSCGCPARTPREGALVLHGHLDVVPGTGVGLAGRPVRRRGARRPAVGPRRRRHEGHGRDDPGGRPADGPRGPSSGARRRRGDVRRRGGRRGVRRPLARGPPPRPVRGRDRGDQRGRRLLASRSTAAAPTCCRRPRRGSAGCGWSPTVAPATAARSTRTTR